MGYIYIIQTGDCYCSASPIDLKTYKIGKTGGENPFDRFKGYRGKAPVIYFVLKVSDEKKAEDELIKSFNTVFKVATQQNGKEYFIGDIDMMIKTAYNVLKLLLLTMLITKIICLDC